jgi:autotransporter-associated beta strand protein
LSPASFSTITLGNPASNGGDGVGKTLVIAPIGTSQFTINDVMQDPPGGSSGSVTYAGNAGGITTINSKSTYTGMTNLNGSSTVRFSSDYNPAVGDTGGPFGVGTLNANNATNNQLQPIGRLSPSGETRIIANPILLSTGVTVSNAPGDTTSVTFTGPISMTNGRTINNSFAAGAGTLTLGSATSPSTITGGIATGVTLTLSNTGNTVINDAIREIPGSGNATNISISGAGNLTANGVISTAGLVTVATTGGTNAVPSPAISFTAMNTYTGGTAFTGAGTLLPIVNSSNALPGPAFTAGPFGTGLLNVNAGTNQHFRPTGGDRFLSNPVLMTTGIAMDNGPGESFNLTLAGPLTMTNNRFISNGFTTGTTGGTFVIGAAAQPSTLTLPATSNFTLSLAALAGPIVVNDVIQNANGQTDNVAINPNAGNVNTVTFTAANTYSGTTTVSGGRLLVSNTSGSATGSSAVTVSGSTGAGNGTLGGNGSIAGAVTVTSASATAAGVLSPGTSLGQLTVGTGVTAGNTAMTWKSGGAFAGGAYVFEHKVDSAQFVGGPTTPTPGTDNDNVRTTGGGTLDLSLLSSATPFTVNLAPVGPFPAAPPTQPVAYTAATFGTINLPAGLPAGSGTLANGVATWTDASSLFTFTGSFASTPIAAVNGGVLYFQFTPVPEPAFVLLACSGLAGLAAWRRKRRAAEVNV